MHGRRKEEESMLVKCICTNCAGHLEFEEENVGEKIECPHCGFETVLTLPGMELLDGERVSWVNRWKLRERAIWIAGAVFVVAMILFSLLHWGLPAVQGLLPDTVGTFGALFVLGLGCWLLLGVAIWVVFPVVMYLKAREAVGILGQLEMNLRPVASVEPPPSELTEEPVEIAEEEHSGDEAVSS